MVAVKNKKRFCVLDYLFKFKTKYLFYLSYALLLFYWFFVAVDSIEFWRVIAIKASYVLLAIDVLLVFIRQFAKTKKFPLGWFLTLAIMTIPYFVNGSNLLLLMVLFLVAGKELLLKQVIKFDLTVKIFFFLTILLLNALGMTDTFYITTGTGAIRSSMGFSHPNVFGIYVFGMCAEICYLLHDRNIKNVVFESVLVLLTGVFVWVFSGSRTAVIGLAGLLLCILLSYPKSVTIFVGHGVKWVVEHLYFILTVLMLVVVGLFGMGNGFAEMINSATSNRIAMSQYYIEKYGVNPFGNDIDTLGTKEAEKTNKKSKAKVLDSSYMTILIKYGLLCYLLFGYLYYLGIVAAEKKKDRFLVMILVLYLFYGIMENVLIYLPSDAFLFMLGGLLGIKTSGDRVSNNLIELEVPNGKKS